MAHFFEKEVLNGKIGKNRASRPSRKRSCPEISKNVPQKSKTRTTSPVLWQIGADTALMQRTNYGQVLLDNCAMQY
ncbi:hypothetical protein ASC96_14725 [Rhizobium sp. Root1204]|nr:hypothetical protein ASC96_14725 [Rhizobium sp. Root1204]